MKPRNLVSLWLGRARSDEALRSVLEAHHVPGESRERSAFEDGVGLEGKLADISVEAARRENPSTSLKGLLAGVPHEVNVRTALEAAGASLFKTDNCFVLLYGHAFEGPMGAKWVTTGLALRFAGAASYSKAKRA